MFTISQIKEAHSKVKSGADFPAYVQALIQLGVIRYNTFVYDGHTEFSGRNNDQVVSEAKYESLEIAANSDAQTFKDCLKIHQKGGTDYLTFCKQAAATGIEKWSVEMAEMTCTYYDQKGNTVLVEKIPAA